MLEFKIIQELKPNTEILEIIKSYTYITKNGKVKHLLKTNLQFVEPTEYIITYPTTLTILEYKASDLLAWVRFPHLAPFENNLRTSTVS